MLRIGIFLVILLVVGGSIFAGYKVWTNMQEKIYVLTDENTKLTAAVETQKRAMEALERNLKAAQEETAKINEKFSAISEQNRVLSGKLEKYDLATLGESKPSIVSKMVNRGTDHALRCFELLSGAKLTDAEKNATNGKEFNRECPWLWKDPEEAK